jgi:hypothetical protein
VDEIKVGPMIKPKNLWDLPWRVRVALDNRFLPFLGVDFLSLSQ